MQSLDNNARYKNRMHLQPHRCSSGLEAQQLAIFCWLGMVANTSMAESVLPHSQKALEANNALQTSLQLT